MNIYKRRFINYWNGKKDPAIYTFFEDGVNYDSVKEIQTEVMSHPLGLQDNYTISDTTITNQKHKVFNIVDFDFNGATIPGTSVELNDVFDLLAAVQDLKSRINTLKQ